MECKGKRTMKHCAPPPEEPTSTSTNSSSLLVGTFLISLLRRNLPTLLQTWGIPMGGKSSSGSGPHIKTTKQSSQRKQGDEVKWEVGRRMRAVVDEGGNESLGRSSAGHDEWLEELKEESGTDSQLIILPASSPCCVCPGRNHKTSTVVFFSYLCWEFPCSLMCSLRYMTPLPCGTC